MENTAVKQAEKLHDSVKSRAYSLIERLENLISGLPEKGLTPSDCQRMNILCQIKELEYRINGLCIEDFL